MPSHYEERLQRDLNWIQELVGIVGQAITKAIDDAVTAVMNLDKEGWALETQDGAVMNGSTVEHIKEAAAVMGRYCDIIGIRSTLVPKQLVPTAIHVVES